MRKSRPKEESEWSRQREQPMQTQRGECAWNLTTSEETLVCGVKSRLDQREDKAGIGLKGPLAFILSGKGSHWRVLSWSDMI